MTQGENWLLFDLGGVLMNFAGMDGLAEMTGRPVPEIHDLLLYSDAIKSFQTGGMTPEQFAPALTQELGLALSPAEFLHLWAEWETGPMDGALELLDALKQTQALACLSNTNVVHWDRLTSRYGLRERFEHCYVSHEIGLSKPDPRIFAHVAEGLGTQPDRITFFDDNADIIAAANSFGFKAHQVNGPTDIIKILG
jgi:glucose-1-phosphatase